MTTTELANMALRAVITQTQHKDTIGDRWDTAWFTAQIAIIECYFEPDPALVELAKKAVDALAAK